MSNTTTGRKERAVSLSVLALLTALLFVGFLCFFAARWYVLTYGDTGFDSILFTLQSSLDGMQSGLIIDFITDAFVPTLLWTLAMSVILFLFLPRLHVLPAVSILLAVVLTCSMTVYAAIDVELDEYIWNQIWKTDLYESEYVDPNTVEITFPEEKRNLVYIVLESMEVSYFDQENGGAMEVNLIPELCDLAKENTNFSSTDGVGGFHATNGASWTIASLVAQTAGIPLKTPSGNQNDYGSNGEEFLPGVTSITNILEDAGYYTSFMCGSDANFGGREPYFLQHGMDRIYDVYTARRDAIIPKNYFVWWGMEDLYLFEYAKQALTEISQGGEPFAFTMLTVDTHHIGGYQCQLCTDEFEESYEQSLSCSSRQVLSFLEWLQQQPFYENTTVIITGDHLSMDNGYFQRNVDEDYGRMVYNVIINAPLESDNTKNREYCAVDLFPTTLAALGCTIEGDRLGLGTNLYSDLPTLAEKMGYDDFNAELSKASEYYSEHFFAQEEPQETTAP